MLIHTDGSYIDLMSIFKTYCHVADFEDIFICRAGSISVTITKDQNCMKMLDSYVIENYIQMISVLTIKIKIKVSLTCIVKVYHLIPKENLIFSY